MKLKPIAVVRNGVSGNIDDWDELVSRLVFDEEYVEGLVGLEERKRIWVLFGFHRRRGWSPLVHPRNDPSRELRGVFATRSPRRPNRIGLTNVELLSVRGRTVTVRGLDAYDGSPVWDIKPYEGRSREQRGRPGKLDKT